MRGCVLSFALVLAATSAGPAVFAGPESKPTPSALDRARSQFHQGLALETAGDWSGALALFQQVAYVKLTPQVRFHIGLCEEHLGQLAAALGDYDLAAHEADESKVAEVSAQVASRRDELKARIPELTITRGSGGEYASVSLDGVSLGGSSIGIKLPVDPGPHSVEARAPGFKPFRVTIDIVEKESKKVEITLERIPAPAMAPDPVVSGTRAVDTSEPARASVIPFVIGGVGVASLGAGVVFLMLRQNAITTLDSVCTLPNRGCPADAQSTYDQGRTYNLLANVTLGAGVVGVGVGTILFFTQKKPKAATSFGVAPGAQSSALGATVVGSF
jgi:PEGA domain